LKVKSGRSEHDAARIAHKRSDPFCCKEKKRQISIKIVEQMSLVTLFIVSLSKVTIGEREGGWDRRALPPYSYHHTSHHSQS